MEGLKTVSVPGCTVLETKDQKTGLCSTCRPVVGIFFALLSALSMVTMNTFAKLCLILPPFEIGIFRFVIQLVFCIPSLIYYNTNLVYPRKVMILLILRGVIGACAVFTRLYAVQNMPLGDATVLTFISPVFTAIFARIFLKEKLHWIYSVLLILCLTGATLIARPTFIFGHPDTAPEYDNIFIPSLIALICAGCTSCVMVVTRSLVGTYKVQSDVILFYFGIVGLFCSILGSYFDRGFQFPFCQSLDYLFALLSGLFAYLSQVFMNGALKFEKAFIVALGRSSGIIFGFIFQILIYLLIPSILSFGGASIIISSNILIFAFKLHNAKTNKMFEPNVP